jgi:hypothetical protein
MKEAVAAGGPVQLGWASPDLGDAPELSDAASAATSSMRGRGT